MKIYIDSEFKCHLESAEDRTEIETEAFEGKCREFIEGFRYVPSDEVFIRDDGELFCGEMIAPFMPYEEIDAVQREYEKKLLAEYKSALLAAGAAVSSL